MQWHPYIFYYFLGVVVVKLPIYCVFIAANYKRFALHKAVSIKIRPWQRGSRLIWIKYVWRHLWMTFELYLSLWVVEVGRDSNNSLCDGVTQERIGCLLHLGQDHWGDLLREEGLYLTLVFSLNLGFTPITYNLKKNLNWCYKIQN